MSQMAAVATAAEIKEAAEYLSKLQPQNRTKVIETDMVPRAHVAGWILTLDNAGPGEPIGPNTETRAPGSLPMFRLARSRPGRSLSATAAWTKPLSVAAATEQT